MRVLVVVLLVVLRCYVFPSQLQTKDTSSATPSTPSEQLKAFDANAMLERSDKPVTVVLEQSNVGRGRNW